MYWPVVKSEKKELRINKKKKQTITISIPLTFIKTAKALKRLGYFSSVSDIVRQSIKRLLKTELGNLNLLNDLIGRVTKVELNTIQA